MPATIPTIPVPSPSQAQKPGVRPDRNYSLAGLQQAIRRYLKAQGWTQEQAAKKADVTRSYFSRALNTDGSVASEVEFLVRFATNVMGYRFERGYTFRVVDEGNRQR